MFARTMARDYEGALEALTMMPDSTQDARPPALGVPDKLLAELQIRWFMGDDERAKTLLKEARSILQKRIADGSQHDTRALLGEAKLAATEGDSPETQRLIRRWYREGAWDVPERVQFTDQVCQTLAAAGAAEAADQCLRTAFEEPSDAMPFLEPYLPFYDGIREEPEFVQLVAGLEAAGA
jgi:hypothetical protein